MNKMRLVKKLVKLADALDKKGLYKEAEEIDEIIKSAASQDTLTSFEEAENIVKKEYKESDSNGLVGLGKLLTYLSSLFADYSFNEETRRLDRSPKELTRQELMDKLEKARRGPMVMFEESPEDVIHMTTASLLAEYLKRGWGA